MEKVSESTHVHLRMVGPGQVLWVIQIIVFFIAVLEEFFLRRKQTVSCHHVGLGLFKLTLSIFSCLLPQDYTCLLVTGGAAWFKEYRLPPTCIKMGC